MLKKDIETIDDPGLESAQMRSSVTGFSIEVLPRDAKRIGDFREHLPPGTLVYVGWGPNTEVDEIVRVASKISRQGMTPVPHIAARRIPSERLLWDVVGELVRDAGVRRLLMLGGDPNPPEGPYGDASSILTSGVLQESGVSEVDVAAHPEGHPAMDAETLRQVLEGKVAAASRAGLGVHAITQFTLVPQAIRRWYSDVYSNIAGRSRLRLGIPGIVSRKALMKLAWACGVSGTLDVVRKNGWKFASAASTPHTGRLVADLASMVDDPGEGRIAGFHFFPFGNFEKTAAWACAVADGNFSMHNGEPRVAQSASGR